VTSSEALERPRPAEKSPEKSLGTDPQAAEQEPAGGSETVCVHLFPECILRYFHPRSCPAQGIPSTCVTLRFSLFHSSPQYLLDRNGSRIFSRPFSWAAHPLVSFGFQHLSCLPALFSGTDEHPCLMLLRACRLNQKVKRKLQATSSPLHWNWSQSHRR